MKMLARFQLPPQPSPCVGHPRRKARSQRFACGLGPQAWKKEEGVWSEQSNENQEEHTISNRRFQCIFIPPLTRQPVPERLEARTRRLVAERAGFRCEVLPDTGWTGR